MTIDLKIIGIISIILNIVFAILLFFKSALNEILKGWWLDRKKKKEEAIKRLIDFKTKFNLQQTQCFLLIVTLAQKQVGLNMERTIDQIVEDTYQKSLSTSSEARNAISGFLDYLPVTLINQYKKYEEQFTEIMKKIMEGKVYKEDLIAYSEEMTSLGMRITNLTDSILREKIE